MSRLSSCWLILVMQGGLLLTAAGSVAGEETGATTPGHAWKTPAGWKMLEADRLPNPPGIEYSEVRLMTGDDPRWAQPGYADGAWRVLAFGYDVPVRTGIFWLRFRVRLPGLRPPLTMRLVLNGSYDLFWDGSWIGSSGRPGRSREEEVPGMLANTFDLPATALHAGEHAVALRMSSHRFMFPQSTARFIVNVATPREFEDRRVQSLVFSAMAFGSLLMLALASLIIWLFAGRRRAWLLFAALCFCAALSQAANVFGVMRGVLYPWQYPLTLGNLICMGIFGVFLVATVVDQYQVSRGKWLLGVFFALATAIIVVWRATPSIAYRDILLMTFVAALGGTLLAIWRGRRDAFPAAAGLAASLTWVLWATVVRGSTVGLFFYQFFLPTVLGFAAALGWRWSDERRQAQEAKLTAARLEIEMLRKQLQPHFLMNTLTALAQAIDENPACAARLIDDLAVETRTLGRMTGEKLVPLGQELDLCRAHLRVLSVRTERLWQLEAEGHDPAAPVPPALFLTLIENGFSHQRPAAADSTFTLRSSMAGRATRYCFLSPGEVQADAGRSPGGTGLRYIKARLEESFPGGWSFAQCAVSGGWETVIEVRAPATREAGA